MLRDTLLERRYALWSRITSSLARLEPRAATLGFSLEPACTPPKTSRSNPNLKDTSF